VYIIVREDEFFEFAEPFEFSQVAMAHNIIESHILEAYLLNRFLEIRIIQDFQGIPVDE